MIDFHTHPVMIKELVDSDPELARAVRDVFGLYMPPQPLVTFLDEMTEAGVDRAVLLPLDCTTAHNCRIVSNEAVAELAAKHPRFIGFASVDPGARNAPKELERAVRELGLCGLKLDPAIQRFAIEDKDRAYPLYQLCSELRIPLVMHCGLSWAPSGLARLARPILLEEVAQAFPELRLVIAHWGWPWIDEALMLALKYRNIYLDTSIVYSGMPVDTLQKVIADHIGCSILEASLPNQVLFATNYPRVDMRRMVRGIRALGLSPSTQEKLFEGNARLLLDRRVSG